RRAPSRCDAGDAITTDFRVKSRWHRRCSGRGMKSVLRACAPLSCLLACASSDQEIVGQSSAALVDVATFGPNPAQLTMHKYVPATMPSEARPLVVVLHGCTQTPAAYESVGWNDLADEWKFYVLYPQQNTQRN